MLHWLRGFFDYTHTENAVLCYYHTKEDAIAALKACGACEPVHASKNKPGKWFIRCPK